MFADKEVTVFPTYGSRADVAWTIPVRVWVHKRRLVDTLSDAHIHALLSDDDDGRRPSVDEIIRCRHRIAPFLADGDSGERVVLLDDEGREIHRISTETDANGFVEDVCTVSADRVGAFTLTARVIRKFGKDVNGAGRVMLLEPEGMSVVSDIDDTIKITEVPAGRAIVLRNTFLLDYVAAGGMRDRYGAFGDASIHYVSGSPWQLFRLLRAFLVDESGFPEGTFHMKTVRTSLLDIPAFITDLKNLVTGAEATKAQKLEQIAMLMDAFPRRRFVLVGDSGELDPEVFAELRRTRGDQIDRVIIRDVVDARIHAPERLHVADEIIEAPAITRGTSQFARAGS